MKKCLAALIGAALGGFACAQIPIGPFLPNILENYDSQVLGVYTTLSTMGPWATTNPITPGAQLHIVQNMTPTFLPPFNGNHAMVCWGGDVEWRFLVPIKRFGGYWRAPQGIGSPPTAVQFKFYNTSNTLFFTSPAQAISTTAWTWRGYWLFWATLRVEVIGIGGSGGFVGHDETRARW
ncbi:MAG TPA: hypothetical protein PLH94_01600 [Fimbriimonadaceae bacterium]|nr:hypothetical protein [Fimbriimonadaceae bacterium]